MEKFSTIYQRACKRKGGEKNLELFLTAPLPEKLLRKKRDSEILAEMTRKIFQSGFIWRVVDNKWDGFKTVFWDFEPYKLQFASDSQIEKMAQDTRIIRNLTKVKSVRENAYFVQQISEKYNGFANFIADWPVSDITQLWLYLKKEGCRLGGNTGPYFLRVIGKDTFLLTKDVDDYLINQRIVDRHPNSQRDLKIVQDCFNEWQQQSGRSLSEISRIISCSIGRNEMKA